MTELTSASTETKPMVKAGAWAGSAVIAASVLLILLYVDADTSSLLLGLLTLLAILIYFAALLWMLILTFKKLHQKKFIESAGILFGVAIMSSMPLWGRLATTAIDLVRFHYNERLYETAAREQLKVKTQRFVVFDWGRSGTMLTNRTHNLVYTEDANRWMPIAPEGCVSTTTRLSEKFYSQRITCS